MPEAAQAYTASSPVVELRLGAALLPAEIAAITAANSTANPEESIKQALRTYIAYAQRKAQEELLDVAILEDTVIRRTLDTTWQLFMPQFVRATGPMIAEAYINAFRAADAGDVPIQMIYSLADAHAARLGKYFNDTSSDAMIDGFNTYVNRQIPKKAAFQRVMQAYGMSPRQVSGLTSLEAPKKVESKRSQPITQKVKTYIARSIQDRLNLFGTQETHNLDEQSKQIAWTWLVEKKRLPATAEKMWLTAKDELVCKQCGPMHGRKAPLKGQFTLPNGTKLYTPGAHVNCRCEVRLQVNPFKVVKSLTPIAKADFDESEVRRDKRGRFAEEPISDARPFKDPVVDPRVDEIVAEAARQKQIDELAARYRLEREARQAKKQEKKKPVSMQDLLGPRLVSPTMSQLGMRGPVSMHDLLGTKPSVAMPSMSVAMPRMELRSKASERAYQKIVQSPRTSGMQHDPLPPMKKPKSTAVYKSNLVPLHHPHLGVGDEMEISTLASDEAPLGTVTLKPGRSFYNSEHSDVGTVIMHEADSLIQTLVDIHGDGGADLDKIDPRYPREKLRLTVRENDTEEALIALANIDNPDYKMNDYHAVWTADVDGSTTHETMTYAELAKNLGYSKEEVELTLFRMEYGAKGKTFPDGDYKKNLYGEFKVTGRHYLTTEEMQDLQILTKIPVVVIDIEPIAELEVDFIEDDEELDY